MGLVNQVVEPDELLPAAYALARQVMANSPFGVPLTKQVVQANLGAGTLAAGVELENRNQALAASGSQMREALDAFRVGRPADYT